ncbi:MAG: PaaI family thioesterase [Peptoniphilus sp.]|nr:PaaI family thioesterase [Peptoniphilus sp.]MDY3118277.1 PaaI family thioesterase [Peptoniphilus sp.]
MEEWRQERVREIFQRFTSQFDLTVLEHTDDEILARWHVDEAALNPANIAHGGAIFSVTDAICAALGLRNNHLLTKGVNFYYYYSLVLGDATVRARFQKVGRFTSVMEAEVLQNGKLCAKGLFDMAQI